MSFSDELRSLIAKKAEQLDVADALRERGERDEQRKKNELDAAAARVVADVFRPLLAEFCQALLAAGVFRNRTQIMLARRTSGTHVCTLSARGAADVYRFRFKTAVNAAGRIELAAECWREGRRRQAATGSKDAPETGAAWQQVFDAAHADDAVETADNPPHRHGTRGPRRHPDSKR